MGIIIIYFLFFRNHFGKIASMSIFVKDDNPDVIQLRGVGIQPS